jgi:predicted transcriptional regulator
MREKREHTPVPREVALHVVRAWHSGEISQSKLAEAHGLSLGYVNRLVHGEVRPDVYAQVADEHRRAAGPQTEAADVLQD